MKKMKKNKNQPIRLTKPTLVKLLNSLMACKPAMKIVNQKRFSTLRSIYDKMDNTFIRWLMFELADECYLFSDKKNQALNEKFRKLETSWYECYKRYYFTYEKQKHSLKMMNQDCKKIYTYNVVRSLIREYLKCHK